MSGISKVSQEGREIWIVDYSGARESEMMLLATELKEAVISENKPTLVLSVFERNYITPAFMRHVEKETLIGLHLIKKMALTGLTPTQEWILKGYNLFLKRDFKSFGNRADALLFLVDEGAV